MQTAHIVLYLVLVLVNLAFVIAWLLYTRRKNAKARPSAADVAIGIGTNFLDTLGIGNYAQITALFKLRGYPADELIPGTLSVGNSLPSFFGALIFAAVIRVEPLLLACMVVSAGCGAWVGAGFVSRMQRRTIQLLMGTALIIAAFFFTLTNLGVLPPGGTAMGLSGWRFVVAVGANFVFGALMCVGIGNYAPSMALLALLGMHPVAAYPIMIGSDGVLIPVASLGFLKSGRFDQGVALGLAIGGLIGTLLAFPLVAALSSHLSMMRWLVIGVILYAACSMLRSMKRGTPEASAAG